MPELADTFGRASLYRVGLNKKMILWYTGCPYRETEGRGRTVSRSLQARKVRPTLRRSLKISTCCMGTPPPMSEHSDMNTLSAKKNTKIFNFNLM